MRLLRLRYWPDYFSDFVRMNAGAFILITFLLGFFTGSQYTITAFRDAITQFQSKYSCSLIGVRK